MMKRHSYFGKGHMPDAGRSATLAESILAEHERKALRKCVKQKCRVANACFAHYYLAEFQLYRGEDKFPKEMIATIDQIRQLNKAMRKQFMQRLNTDSNTKLWEWRPTDPGKVEAARLAMREFIFTVAKGDYKEGEHPLIEHIQTWNAENFPKETVNVQT